MTSDIFKPPWDIASGLLKITRQSIKIFKFKNLNEPSQNFNLDGAESAAKSWSKCELILLKTISIA